MRLSSRSSTLDHQQRNILVSHGVSRWVRHPCILQDRRTTGRHLWRQCGRGGDLQGLLKIRLGPSCRDRSGGLNLKGRDNVTQQIPTNYGSLWWALSPLFQLGNKSPFTFSLIHLTPVMSGDNNVPQNPCVTNQTQGRNLILEGGSLVAEQKAAKDVWQQLYTIKCIKFWFACCQPQGLKHT